MPTRDERTAALHRTRLFGDRAGSLKILAVFFVVLAAYAAALSNGFVMDDFDLVANNPNVKGFSHLPHIFITGYWDSEGFSRGLYRPLTIFTFWVEHSLCGINPFIYHLDNVLLHFFCTVMGYLIFREILKEENAPFFAALIFAAHPVHTEAVAWVSGRAELLSAFFSLAAILLFIRRADTGRGYAVLAPVSYLLALLSKESAVVVIPLLVVYIMLFEGRASGRKRALRTLSGLSPYIAVSALYFALRFYVLRGELAPVGSDQALYGLGAYDRFLTMSRALYEYVRLGLLPFGLKAFYMFPPPASLFDMKVITPLLSAILLLLLAPRLARTSRPILFSAAWFFIALIPVSNIIPIGVIMSERAMYMPSLGLCMLLGYAFNSAFSPGAAPAGRRRLYVTLLLVTVLASFTAGSIARDRVWRDHKSFMPPYMESLRQGIERYPDYEPIYRLRARMQVRFCDFGPEFEEAVKEEALRAGGSDPEIHSMLADVYEGRSMPREALREINDAIRLDPQANYYFQAARLLMALKDYAGAERLLDEAIAINPNRAHFYLTKGEMLMEEGDDAGALRLFEHAEALDPENQDAYLDEGIALDSMKRFGPAVGKVRRAVELRPDIPDLHYFLAVEYMDNGQRAEAETELKAALGLKPDYKEARDLLQKTGRAGR